MMGFNETGPIVDRESYQKFYDANSHFSNQHITEDWGRINWLLPFVSGDVLEVGCQDGGVTVILVPCSDTLLAIDITDEHVERTRNHIARNFYGVLGIHVQKTYIEDFETGTKFDTIVLFEVLEHVLDDRLVLQKCYDLLRVGGDILISVPFEDFFPEPDHLRQYTVGGMTKLLAEYGPAWVAIIEESEGQSKWIIARLRKKP